MNKQLIELIINALTNGKEIDAYALYKICEKAGYKRGTYTSYLSMMKKAGYVRRVKPRVYAIGKMASTTTIDHNLRRLSLHKKAIQGTRPEMSLNAPAENPSESLFKKPYTPFKTEESKERCHRIHEAIEVLKSYGIKVTLEF